MRCLNLIAIWLAISPVNDSAPGAAGGGADIVLAVCVEDVEQRLAIHATTR